eukprot:ctg_769.g381
MPAVTSDPATSAALPVPGAAREKPDEGERSWRHVNRLLGQAGFGALTLDASHGGVPEDAARGAVAESDRERRRRRATRHLHRDHRSRAGAGADEIDPRAGVGEIQTVQVPRLCREEKARTPASRATRGDARGDGAAPARPTARRMATAGRRHCDHVARARSSHDPRAHRRAAAHRRRGRLAGRLCRMRSRHRRGGRRARSGAHRRTSVGRAGAMGHGTPQPARPVTLSLGDRYRPLPIHASVVELKGGRLPVTTRARQTAPTIITDSIATVEARHPTRVASQRVDPRQRCRKRGGALRALTRRGSRMRPDLRGGKQLTAAPFASEEHVELGGRTGRVCIGHLAVKRSSLRNS